MMGESKEDPKGIVKGFFKSRLFMYFLIGMVLIVAVTGTIAGILVHDASLRSQLHAEVSCPVDMQGSVAGNVTEEKCKGVGCIWIANDDAPSCFLPPTNTHGYTVINTTDFPNNGTRVFLQLKSSSAMVVPSLKENLQVDLTLYSDSVFRIKVTVPGESRYEVPLKLNLPPPKVTTPKYHVSLGEKGQDFAIRVYRNEYKTPLFDTSIGGFTFADQLLQVSTLLPSRNLFGLGESNHGSFRHDLNYKTYGLFARDQPLSQAESNENLYSVHPMYLLHEDTGNSHVMLWLNSHAMEVETMPLPGLTLRAIGGVMDFFFFLGSSPGQAVSEYTNVIGRPQLPPYWSLGFQLSRFGYNSLSNMNATIQRTKDHNIPQDVQYGDIDHLDASKVFTFDAERFKDLPSFVQNLKKEGIRFVPIVNPAINAELSSDVYLVHQRALEKKVYVQWPSGATPSGGNYGQGDIMLGSVWPENRTGFPDFLRSNTTDWWEKEILLYYNILNFSGVWLAMNEPTNYGTNEVKPSNSPSGLQGWSLKCNDSQWDDPPYPTLAARRWGVDARLSDKTLCMVGLHGENLDIPHYSVHNLYGWSQMKSTLKGLEEATGQRGFVLSRSTFPSSGVYGAHWSGDNSAEWPHLHNSIISMLEFNLFGIPHVGADICGFLGNTTEELCERWMELGAFYPLARNHNHKDAVDQDPGVWESVANSSRRALTVRYTLLPYLYTLFYLANTRGDTVVRPLFFEFPTDLETVYIDDAFMWGPAVMIAPILLQDHDRRIIYFPACFWYDYYEGVLVHNQMIGLNIIVLAPKWHIPVYLRGGSIVVTQGFALNTLESRQEPLGILVAPDSNEEAEGVFFWDDGEKKDTLSTLAFYTANITYAKNTVTWKVNNVSTNTTKVVKDLMLSTGRVLGVKSIPKEVLVNKLDLNETMWSYENTTQVLHLYGMNIHLEEDFTISWNI